MTDGRAKVAAMRDKTGGACQCRALSLEDAERCAQISTAIAARAGSHETIPPRSLRVEWTEPKFDLKASSIGLVDGEDQLLGYAVFFALAEPPVRPWLSWGVDPDRGDGDLRARLLAWACEQAEAAMAQCPPDARVSLWVGAYKGYRPDEIALEAAGFTIGRVWHEMRIDMREAPAAAELPPGFVSRPYRPEADLPLLVALTRDAFSDHYGHIEQSFERDMESFQHWFGGDPNFDPERVMLAADEATGELAGCLMPLTDYERRPGCGYVDTLGVRKAYRRRGLASALLRRGFADYWRRGVKSVCLEVDGDSLTKAVALYEGVGMRVSQSTLTYEKLLRDGVELAKVALE